MSIPTLVPTPIPFRTPVHTPTRTPSPTPIPTLIVIRFPVLTLLSSDIGTPVNQRHLPSPTGL